MGRERKKVDSLCRDGENRLERDLHAGCVPPWYTGTVNWVI